jgi:hypothetical protein
MLVVTDAVVGVGDMGSKDKFFLAPFRNWETNKKTIEQCQKPNGWFMQMPIMDCDRRKFRCQTSDNMDR